MASKITFTETINPDENYYLISESEYNETEMLIGELVSELKHERQIIKELRNSISDITKLFYTISDITILIHKLEIKSKVADIIDIMNQNEKNIINHNLNYEFENEDNEDSKYLYEDEEKRANRTKSYIKTAQDAINNIQESIKLMNFGLDEEEDI